MHRGCTFCVAKRFFIVSKIFQLGVIVSVALDTEFSLVELFDSGFTGHCYFPNEIFVVGHCFSITFAGIKRDSIIPIA